MRRGKHSEVQRTTFTTSRSLEFCSEKELVAQTGAAVEDWPLYIFKELDDNGLDGCEEAGTAPQVSIAIHSGKIVVTDNGLGIPDGRGLRPGSHLCRPRNKHSTTKLVGRRYIRDSPFASPIALLYLSVRGGWNP